MVVLIIDIVNLSVFDPEGEPPVPRDVQAPDAFPVARKLMSFPGRERPESFGIPHVLQVGQHGAQLIGGVGGQSACVVFEKEPLQTLVNEVPDFQLSL